MRTIQLDKNAGGKKLRDACNREGAVACFLLPEHVRDKTDCEVLEFGIARWNLTLSFDRLLYFSHAHVIQGRRNPGGVILRMDEGSVRQISTKTAPSLLSKFKTEFPQWSTVPWENSLVEITPTLIFVHHTLAWPIELQSMLLRSETGWQEKLARLLQENALQPAADSIEQEPSPSTTPEPAD